MEKLVQFVEEATRTTREAPTLFVEPAQGTLARAKSKHHHIVFGRRGSGKTSMLRKAMSDLSDKGSPVAFVDLESFKEHSYPDVLVSVLIATLKEFKKWLKNRVLSNEQAKSTADELEKDVSDRIHTLQGILYSSNDSESIEVAAESATAGQEPSLSRHEATQRTSIIKHSKIDYLHRHIMDFQDLFESIAATFQGDMYAFLDDLYHLRREDQTRVIDYFHRIAKGRRLWLKFGTIKHRTQWYKHGQPPIGMKLGDDCDEIDLDITLEKYESAKSFLYKILDELVTAAGFASHGQILADGAVDRLVLASGGVARDFLTIFRKSVDHARERGYGHARGSKIGAEDVNSAAGEHDSTKRDELIRDANDEKESLESVLARVQAFCIENRVNCFLIPRNKTSPGVALLNELLDLRFLHLAASRVTVRETPGALHICYLLDVSQYTGERKRRDLEMVEFWKRDKLDRLRRVKHVFDPDAISATAERGGSTLSTASHGGVNLNVAMPRAAPSRASAPPKKHIRRSK